MQKRMKIIRHCIYVVITWALILFSAYLTLRDNISANLISTPNEYNLFYYSFIWGNSLLNVMFPILPALLIGELALSRSNKLSNILIACWELILPVIIFAIICIFSDAQYASFNSSGIYSELFDESAFGIVLGYIINYILITLAYAFLSFAVYKEKTYLHILIPLITYNIGIFNTFTGLSNYLPIYCYDVVSLQKSLITHIISIIIVIALAGTILAVGFLKKKGVRFGKRNCTNQIQY